MEPAARLSPAKRCAAICGGLLLIFTTVAWLSFQHEAATIDEPLHAVGAYNHVFNHDYRINPEDPPLWNYLAMLFHYRGELHDRTPPGVFRAAADDIRHSFAITVFELYETAGNDGAAFINLTRSAMLLGGVALGIALAFWAYRLAGTTAAVAACVLFCFDPNFLAHTRLIKNDVALSLVLLATTWIVSVMGRRLTWVNLIGGLLIIASGPVVKFSGVLVVFIAVTLLWLRALLPWPWHVLRFELRSIVQRLSTALILTMLIAGVCDLGIWTCYGFRYDPTPEPGLLLNPSWPMIELKQNVYRLRNGRYPDSSETHAMPLPLTGQLEQFAERHQLLPQAWLYGMLFTYRSTLIRFGFLFGELYELGHWYYFPCTMLFKMPIATLLTIVLAGASLLIPRRHSRLDFSLAPSRWPLICIVIALAIYTASALTTNLNLGIRHILPMFPLIYLLVAMRFSRLLPIAPRLCWSLGGLLAAGLVVETLASFPHYISFFNAPSRPYRLSLLSDSNFDWGQDLPYVADWQRQHPAVPLYLCYWCAADPAFYGIRYHNMPGGYVLRGNPEWPPVEPHAAIAVCATTLQGVNCAPEFRPVYAELRKHQPSAILGDSIYLYEWPLK